MLPDEIVAIIASVAKPGSPTMDQHDVGARLQVAEGAIGEAGQKRRGGELRHRNPPGAQVNLADASPAPTIQRPPMVGGSVTSTPTRCGAPVGRPAQRQVHSEGAEVKV